MAVKVTSFEDLDYDEVQVIALRRVGKKEGKYSTANLKLVDGKASRKVASEMIKDLLSALELELED
jgi:hypothetical protein